MASKKSKAEEALKFLDDLDSFAPPPDEAAPGAAATTKSSPPVGSGNEGEAAEVLAFLDEITQKSTEPTRATIPRSGTPTMRKSTERVRLGAVSALSASASSSTTSLNRSANLSDTAKTQERTEPQPASTSQPAPTSQPAASSGGWGWGSVWSSASAAVQQAKSVVDEQVKHLPKNEQARKWGEGVFEYAKSAQLDKLSQDFKRVGLSTLTDILNVVAPPISEHEVIQVWLSHDMQGYEGIESLAYRSLARVLEQVKGGDLVVNRGNESRPKDSSNRRELNAVDSYQSALKLSQANIEEVRKKNAQSTQTTTNPNTATTYSHVFLRIQPFFTTFEQPPTTEGAPENAQKLQFLLYIFDPVHKLTHTAVTQAVPSGWLDVWDEYDWVEDLIAESLRIGFEVLGQEYVFERMGWGSKAATHSQEVSTSVDPGEKEDKPDSTS